MPSIPQSLLWISLVVLWLFVLVPMLISKRDAVRRTSDVALATRVLTGGAGARLLKRGGPAAGHRSDPDWQHDEQDWDDEPTESMVADLDLPSEADYDDLGDDLGAVADARHPVVMRMPVPENAEPDYLDVDVIEDSAALPAGVAAAEVEADDRDETGDAHDEYDDEADDEYEYVEDSSGLEPGADDDEAPYVAPVASASARMRRSDTRTAAVTARKYAFRKRVLLVMAAILLVSAISAFEVSGAAWAVFAMATTVTVLYLAYLRRQTRIEEKVRRRRMQRMARARVGVENTYDREYEVVPSRLRRPGAVVLEIDDEDPIFEHLDYAMPHRGYGWPRDLPRAVGQ